jgi:hypothetical protein
VRGSKDQKKNTIQTEEWLVGEGGQKTKEKYHTDTEKKLVGEGAKKPKKNTIPLIYHSISKHD